MMHEITLTLSADGKRLVPDALPAAGTWETPEGVLTLCRGMTVTEDGRLTVTTRLVNRTDNVLHPQDVLVTPLCAREGIALLPGGTVGLSDLVMESGDGLSALLSAHARRMAADMERPVRGGAGGRVHRRRVRARGHRPALLHNIRQEQCVRYVRLRNHQANHRVKYRGCLTYVIQPRKSGSADEIRRFGFVENVVFQC